MAPSTGVRGWSGVRAGTSFFSTFTSFSWRLGRGRDQPGPEPPCFAVGGVAGGLLAVGVLVVGVGAAVGLAAGDGELAAGADEPDEPLLVVVEDTDEESDGSSGIATCW